MTDDEQLKHLIEADEARLFEHIGAHAIRGSVGARPATPRELEKEGRAWLKRHTAELRNRVCSSLVVKTYLGSDRAQDRVLLVAAVADLVSSLVTGIAAISVAVLIVREGLATWCKESAQH
jgi:hypothetical protein